MTILLTGSGGFIGAHVAEHLRHCGFEVLAPRSCELDLLDCQAVDAFFREYHIDLIVHSAARGVRIRQEDTMEDVARPNLTMFQHLSSHVSPSCRLIVLGSGAEYDKRRPLCKVQESEFGLYEPVDPYGLSKYVISQQIMQNPHMVDLRIFGIYGPGEHASRFISDAVIHHLKGETFPMRRDARFDFLEIGDLCRAVEAVIRRWPESLRCFNITPTESSRLSELLPIVAKCVGCSVEVTIANEGMSPEYTGDNSLFLKEYPGFDFTPVQTGIARLVAYLKGQCTE